MPWRTRACSTVSRWRGGRLWRAARCLAATGSGRACSATSTTAAMASRLRRERRNMVGASAFSSGEARRAETAAGARRPVEFVDLDQRHAGDGRDHELGDPHSSCNGEGLWPKVYEQNLNFTAKIFINGPGGVEHGDSAPKGEARAGPHLRFVRTWQ